MKFKKLKLIFAAVAGAAICSTFGVNLHAAEVNYSNFGHTNYNDELVYKGRVYSSYGGSSSAKNDIEDDILDYKSQNLWIINQKITNTSTNKVLSNKWYYAGASQKQAGDEISDEYKKVTDPIFESEKLEEQKCEQDQESSCLSGETSTGSGFSAGGVVDAGHVIGWRKIGKTWFFIYNGVITKTKTNAKYPKSNIMYGYALTGNKEWQGDRFDYTDPTMKKLILKHIAPLGGGQWTIRKYSRVSDAFFVTFGKNKKYILVDQFTGKVIYNKSYPYYQYKYYLDSNKIWKIHVKKFYIKSDKHGYVVKGTYRGISDKWIFGKNGVLKKHFVYK